MGEVRRVGCVDGHAERDETVPQLSWCPFLRLEPSVLGHLAEGTPNVGCIDRGAESRREDEIIVGPSCRVAHATLGLPASVRSKRDYAFVREFKGAPGQSRLGVTAFSHRSP